MNSSREADIIRSLNYTSQQLNRYFSIIIFIFGVVGNILNCFVLSQRTLRSNPCALLFLVSSFLDLISILAGLTTRILAGWDLDPTTTIHSLCKLRAFTVFSTRTMATWLVVLATTDRWLSSSVDVHRRHMSTLKNVKRGITATIILSAISYIFMIGCYEANITDAPLKCYGKTPGCRIVTDLIYALITTIIPLSLMTIFGLLTVSNVHHIHTRVQHHRGTPKANHQGGQRDPHLRRIDRQLLRMLLVQVLLLIFLYIPQVFQKFYVTLKPFGSGSQLEDVIKTFLYNLEILLAFIASGMPFYIYTLAGGSIFREAFMNFIRIVARKMECRFN